MTDSSIRRASVVIIGGGYGGITAANSLSESRDGRGYIRVDEQLRVVGETNVFAVGDVSDADRDMAGIASRQAGLVAANIRALITGEGELAEWETMLSLIAIPLGHEGGAGLIGDGVAGPETIAEIKGRDMLIDNYGAFFNAGAGV